MQAQVVVQPRFGQEVFRKRLVGAVERYSKIVHVGGDLQIRQRHLIAGARAHPLLPQALMFRTGYHLVAPDTLSHLWRDQVYRILA